MKCKTLIPLLALDVTYYENLRLLYHKTLYPRDSLENSSFSTQANQNKFGAFIVQNSYVNYLSECFETVYKFSGDSSGQNLSCGLNYGRNAYKTSLNTYPLYLSIDVIETSN